MAAGRPAVAAWLAYVVLALCLTWPLPLHLSTHLPGSPSGDTGVYVWNLWVFGHEISQGRLPFYTSSILSGPGTLGPVNLSLHNYTTFANVLALPLTPFLGIVAAFNVIYILNIALAGFTMYLLARELIGRHQESWLAGALFTASPMLIARGTAHFSLVAAAPLPLFCLFLSRAIRHQRPRDAMFAGLVVAWAAFCDAYYAVYCLLLAVFMLGAHTLQVRRPAGELPPRRIKLVRFVDVLLVIVGGFIAGMTIRGGGPMIALGSMIGVRLSMRTLYTPVLIVSCLVLLRVVLALRPRIHFSGTLMPSAPVVKAAAIGILAMLLPLSPVLYAFGERLAFDNGVGTPVYWRSSPPGVDLLAFLLPNPNHPLWGQPIQDLIVSLSQRPDGYPEFTASIPYVAIGLFVLAWFRWGWRPVPLPVIFPITFALLALGPFVQIAGMNTHIPTPWALLRYVPIVGLARSPSRFAVIVIMGVSTLFALALVHVTNKYATARPDRRRWILAATAALLVFELSPAPRTLYSAEIPAIYQTIANDPSPSVRVLGLPLGVRDGASSIGDYSALSQYFQTAHGKGILGGYVSRVSERRKHRLQRIPMYDALMTLSEGKPLTRGQEQRAEATIDRFIVRTRVKYVVVDLARTSPELLAFASRTLGLIKIEENSGRALYLARPPHTLPEPFGDCPGFMDSLVALPVVPPRPKASN